MTDNIPTQHDTKNIDSLLMNLSTGQCKFNKEVFDVLLENSCYYPSSGIDISPIECFSKIQSFIYCDYIYDETRWINEITKEMDKYEIIFEQQLRITHNFDKHFHYKKDSSSINERTNSDGLLEEIVKRAPPFSLITIWKRNNKYISIIYISSEAVHCYEQIFLKNRITPRAIAIIQPGHTMGGNWTNFFNTNSAFLGMVRKGPLPEYMLLGCYGESDNFFQITYDECNYVKVVDSQRKIKSPNGDSHYVFAVKNKNHSRIDLLDNSKEDKLDLLTEAVMNEQWCVSINCRHCNNWNIRSAINKNNLQISLGKIKSFSWEFLNGQDKFFRILINELRENENGSELIEQLKGSSAYLKIKENIELDQIAEEKYRKAQLIKHNEEIERKRLLQIAATPEAIAERKALRKKLREQKTSPQRNNKMLTEKTIRDFIEKINAKSDYELLDFVTSSQNSISMKASGGIAYARLLKFFGSKKITDEEAELLQKLANDHSWHWRKLITKLKLDFKS